MTEIQIRINAYLESLYDWAEEIYFECPEERGDRPSMHETENQIAEAIDLLQDVKPIAHPDSLGAGGTFFDYSPEPENKPEPIKPTFTSRIKSAFTAIFRRNATA